VDFSQHFQPMGDGPMPEPAQQPAPSRAEAPPGLQPQPAPGGQFAPLAPVVTRQANPTSNATGVGVLLAAAGTGAGFALGGGWGALAGLLLVGATRNAARAASGNRAPDPGGGYSEATKSGTMAIFGFGLGGYFAWLASQDRKRNR